MAWGNIGALACQNLQTNLIDYFGRNAPQYRTLGSVSTIRWILSPQNTANFQRINNVTIPGKKRAVAFRLAENFCFDLARAIRACDDPAGTISQTPKEVVWDLDVAPWRIVDGAGNPLELKVDLEEMQQYCTVDDFTWVTDQINRLLFRYEEQLDKRIMELIAPLAGTNLAGDYITQVPLWVNNAMTNSATLNPQAQFQLSQLMTDIGVDMQYAALGGRILNKVRLFTGWAGLDAAGIDLSKVEATNPFVFYDRNADAILGETDWLQIPPGAVQLVTWNMYGVGSSLRRQVTDLYSKGTIQLPTTGLMIDWKWTFDYTCDIWKFEPLLYGDIVIVPAGGCDTPNANGMIRIRDCSNVPLIPECPAAPAA